MGTTGNADSRPIPWKYRFPRRFTQLQLGLVLYGVSMATMIEASLGLDPWDVFHQGVSERTGLGIGWVANLTGLVVLLLWIPLRQRPGIGTISNVLVVGTVAQITLELMPAPEQLWIQAGLMVGSIVLNGVATGMYIGARLGPGPRDGLMTGFVALKPGRSIRLVRSVIELSVLAVGWVLGGQVGIGTVLYAVSIGPLAHVFIPLFRVPEPAPAADPEPLRAP